MAMEVINGGAVPLVCKKFSNSTNTKILGLDGIYQDIPNVKSFNKHLLTMKPDESERGV